MMVGMRRGVVLVALLMTLAACEGGDEQTPEPAPSASEQSPSPGVSVSVEPAPAFDCPNQGTAIGAPELRVGGTLEGDVLGDGGDAVVSLAVDPQGTDACGAFLIVETSDGEILSTPVFQEGIPGVSRLSGLATIDERPGAEIVVHMVAGASTEFVAVFSAAGGALERMMIEGDDPYGDLFPSGGSVGHLEASNCSPGSEGGSILVSGATPQGDGYRVVRRSYSSRDGVFFETVKDVQTIDDPQDIEMFQEFFGSPFGGCAPGT